MRIIRVQHARACTGFGEFEIGVRVDTPAAHHRLIMRQKAEAVAVYAMQAGMHHGICSGGGRGLICARSAQYGVAEICYCLGTDPNLIIILPLRCHFILPPAYNFAHVASAPRAMPVKNLSLNPMRQSAGGFSVLP